MSSSDSDHDGDKPMRNRSRSSSAARRNRSRSPPPLESQPHAATAAAAAAPSPAARATAASAPAAASSSAGDEFWDSDAEHEDLDDEGIDPTGADLANQAGVTQFLRAIFQRMQGGGGSGAPTAASLEAVLAGLAEQGLVTQDADGNLVLGGDDGDGDGAEDDEDDGGGLEALEDTDESEGEMDGEGEGAEDEEQEDEAAVNVGRGIAIRAQGARAGAGAGARGAGSASPEEPVPKDTAALAEYAAYNQITPSLYPRNVLQSLLSFQRDSPAPGLGATSPAHRAFVSSRHVPQTCSAIEEFDGRAFCGKFSSPSNGAPSRFACATQDGVVHLYETSSWRLYKDIHARSVGWSIVDIDFSTDSRFVIYSSWSNAVQLINTEGAFELHESLDFEPPGQAHVCMFGLRFSTNNSREILAGLNNGFAILYDVERKRKIWSARAHADDINSVCWLDQSGDLFATGSDDASIRIFDRRLLANVDNAESGEGSVPSVAAAAARRAAKPVAGFLGHMHGLTCVAAHPDGNARYLLSNSKDQSMKLWDLRRANNATAVVAATEDRAAQRQMLDYRWQRVSRRDILSSSSASAASASASSADSGADRSLATFTGHSVSQTLIRCDFSPGHSTGHRYAITGSSNGRLYIFDLVTGECVRQIKGHQSIVRDVAWQDDLIVSSSWDHTVRRWARSDEAGLADNAPKHAEMRSQAGRGRRMARGDDDDEEEEE